MTRKPKAGVQGPATDRSPVALLLIDVINHLEFEGGDHLLRHAKPAAERIAALKRRARDAEIPTIYVNDNFGHWRSNFQELIENLLERDVRGRPLIERLRPEADDYFVLKPRHSGFFQTVLDLLLDSLGARRLILTGFATDICVLFTANDAYMRDYELHIPPDAVAAKTPDASRNALDYMAGLMDVDLTPTRELDLERLRQEPN